MTAPISYLVDLYGEGSDGRVAQLECVGYQVGRLAVRVVVEPMLARNIRTGTLYETAAFVDHPRSHSSLYGARNVTEAWVIADEVSRFAPDLTATSLTELIEQIGPDLGRWIDAGAAYNDFRRWLRENAPRQEMTL